MFSWNSLMRWLGITQATSSPETQAVIPGEPGTGALLDTRTDTQKLEDVHFGEVVASASPVQWVKKLPSQWRKFPAFNQDGSSGCVAFTMAKLLGVMRFLKDGAFVIFSGGDIYRRRTTTGGGMNNTDPYVIAAQGVTLEAVMPSQNLSEDKLAAIATPAYAAEIAQLFKIQNALPVVLPTQDIDAVASVIQATGKAVMVWFYFTGREWGVANGVAGDYNIPQLLDSLTDERDPRALRHSVAAVDFTLDDQNRKCLIVEDSALFGGFSRRVVDEHFFSLRNWLAEYPMNLQQVKVDPTALYKYVFTKTLRFIPWDAASEAPADIALHIAQRADVKALQTALQLLTDVRGRTYFPTNLTPSGYYGALTAKAVYAWGSEHLLPAVPQSTLDTLEGKLFGEGHRLEMNRELL